jgi:hypothetical protein
MVTMESSCILELQPPAQHEDVCVRLCFTDPGCTPALVRFHHAPMPTSKFESLGDIRLQSRSLRQLRHLFRLGKHLPIQHCLRITCVGWLAEHNAGNCYGRATHAAAPPCKPWWLFGRGQPTCIC